MKRESSPGVIVGALVVGTLVLGALALGAGGMTTTVTSGSSLAAFGDPEDVEPAEVLITGLHRSGGTSILGFHLGRTTYRVSVQFIAGAGCFELLADGDRWPAPPEECSSPVTIQGEVAGGGRTSRGESIIGLMVETSRECFEMAAVGEPWPPFRTEGATGGQDLPRCLT